MRYTEYYNQPAPELGDLADITVVTDALLAGEKNQSGKIEFLKATISGNVISLTSTSRINKYTKHYDGMTIAFMSPSDIKASDTSHTLKIDELAAQPFKIKTDIKRNDIVIASFNNTDGFITTNAPIPRSSATNSNSEVTVATSKAVNDLKTLVLDKQIVAGNGLTGGGNLNSNVTINVASADDSIIVSDDNIKVNTYNGVDSTSTTRPASANAVKTAYDKAETAKSTADEKVSKSGDTMTGSLIINKSDNNHIFLNRDGVNIGQLYVEADYVAMFNAKSQQQFRMYNNGNIMLNADNLQTSAKEVVEAINESLWRSVPKIIGSTTEAMDLSSLTENGLYYSNAGRNLFTDMPKDTYGKGNSFSLFVISCDSAFNGLFTTQIMFFPIRSNEKERKMYVRHSAGRNEKYGEWCEILTTGSPLYLGVPDIPAIRYIQDDGGAIKGELFIDKITGKFYRAKVNTHDKEVTANYELATNKNISNNISGLGDYFNYGYMKENHNGVEVIQIPSKTNRMLKVKVLTDGIYHITGALWHDTNDVDQNIDLKRNDEVICHTPSFSRSYVPHTVSVSYVGELRANDIISLNYTQGLWYDDVDNTFSMVKIRNL